MTPLSMLKNTVNIGPGPASDPSMPQAKTKMFVPHPHLAHISKSKRTETALPTYVTSKTTLKLSVLRIFENYGGRSLVISMAF